MEKGRAEGLEKGRAEGIEKTKRDNVRRMKALGLATELISQVTGLSAEEIDTL